MDYSQVWLYYDYGEDNFPIRITSAKVLNMYYVYWYGQMIKVGKTDAISFENCIDDWAIINWAWKEGTRWK